mmetsp:Transcript_27734/g.70716  ORF Transcript_27734/g.70716 Transcript_27734/m.70716 type:complete len:209 (+) Transcript_27734:41-667(+)
MGKKGGGKKGGAKKGRSPGPSWVPIAVPTGPILIHEPTEVMDVWIKGVVWSLMDFKTTLPVKSTVADVARTIALHQGGCIGTDIRLYRSCNTSTVHALDDASQALSAIEFPEGGAGVLWYSYNRTSFWHDISQKVASSPRPRSIWVPPDPDERRIFPYYVGAAAATGTAGRESSNLFAPVNAVEMMGKSDVVAQSYVPYRGIAPGGAR